MAPVKRKAVTDERSAKKAKSAPHESAAKPAKTKKPGKDDGSGERKPVAKSILQQEERAFPRGGASFLTPLEQKQIKAQAERDVLFEHQTGQKAPIHPDEDGDLFDEGEAGAAPAKKQRKTKRDGDKKEVKAGIKISGLSYKSLVVGSSVLGYVTAITNKDVALALPNNLTGYVPITAVCESLNNRIEKLLADDAPNGDEDEDDDVDLKQLFHTGQWLRATVTGTGSEEGGKSNRHIELSVDPRQVNAGLDSEDAVVNSMVQAAVRSVEDHGVIVDLGLANPAVKGFVSKKELGAGYELDKMQEGQVLLCLVTGKGSNGKVLKLSPNAAKFSVAASTDKGNNGPVVNEAPTIDAFLPGTAVQILITQSGPGGVAGKVMGMVNVTADIVHSGAGQKDVDMSKRYKIGSKLKGRIVWALPNDDGGKRIGVSFLDHLLVLPPPSTKLAKEASAKLRTQATNLEKRLPVSSIVQDARVAYVLPERGLFLALPSATGEPKYAFAHISQISDTRIDVLTSASGPYKLDSDHKVRIISYSPVDDVYYVSLKESVLEQTYLRLEDLSVGEVVNGKVERLILGGKTGITGILVRLSDSITGLVPEAHLSDVQLQHPERKFREGYPVKARVLSIDLEKRHLRLTLKKTLVNAEDDTSIWSSYEKLEPGMESKGTIVNLLPNGAAVQFFGPVRAWLPVAEMSEGYIERPEQYFRIGQTVNVRILSVDPESKEMKISCKATGVEFDEDTQAAWNAIEGGQMVAGTVTGKGGEGVTLDLEHGLRGTIRLGHLADGSDLKKAEGALKRIRVGQKLIDLVVLAKLERSRQILLTNKPTLVQAAKDASIIKSFGDIKEGGNVRGFVRNVTPEGVYVEFANGLVGLVPKSQIGADMVGKAAFGLLKDLTIHAWVLSVDSSRERFTLSMREQKDANGGAAARQSSSSGSAYSLGQVVNASIASIKATQLNVRLPDGSQGRVDISEVFESWGDIANKKAPLQKFQPNAEMQVKVLGVHDARNHRFLPISHRSNKTSVFELTAKVSRVEKGSEDLLDLTSVRQGEQYLAFVNNHAQNCVWVSLSPNVRGRVSLMDLSDDAGALQNLPKSFPIGSAFKATVKAVDLATGRLDLTAKGAVDGKIQESLTLHDVSTGQVLPGRVTKITERSVTVQLSDALAAPVPLVELSDDYDQVNSNQFSKNDIVRVCVLDVDVPNKRLYLSLRPSNVLSSSLPIKDKQITSHDQLKAGELVRGFVKHVGDKGVIVSLGANVDVFVRVADLSDKYVKDWKTIVEVDELVSGRVLSVDAAAKHANMSLKASHTDANYVPPLTVRDLEVGMVLTGKVRKVEDFGAFVDIDNTQPKLSGLCHRSEVASKRVEDVRKLYSEGDLVKAKILAIDPEKRKISLGLKASYFTGGDVAVEDGDGDSEDAGVEVDVESEADDEDAQGGVDLADIENLEESEVEGGAEFADEMDVDIDDEDRNEPERSTSGGLKTSGFDWNGDAFASTDKGTTSDSEAERTVTKHRKRNKPEIKVDLTGDLDKNGPQSVSDFERLLLGSPNDSQLWIQYMAFQLQLSEIQKARDLAERALRSIHIRETDEKMNVWIAWLNLEVEYGNDERVEEVFKQACQVQDSLTMHERLASIYIDSGKHDKADGIFERLVGNKAFRASPDVWLNYASFLFDKMGDAAKARSLLSRALQSVPSNEHRLLTAKFAALEFRSAIGDPERGRTVFEGLVSEWSKWSSGWDMWVDLERSRLVALSSDEQPVQRKKGKKVGSERSEQAEKVRALYERMAAQKMKKRRAKFVFKKWLEFEEKEGDERGVERVKALAKAYVEAQAGKGEEDEE
ncbi:nucleic acid-binding protein [Teratosphaeria nubilosa]|uniref:rRNA biogenesis protein RRP5 n=1 Tax=Teratosphaeria nubilosa TaxID=161662 RepID=A0A6G1LJR1_9PEZI|nr:nucleic acid-binding protein [Teratosphaeria nubilosa]